MCHDREDMSVVASAIVAVDAAYWFAGLLTLVASAIVIVVMLMTSRGEDDDSS